MPRLSKIALAAPIALAAGMASAATIEPIVFDFGQLADESKREHGTELEWGASEFASDGHTVGDITVRASDRAHLDGGHDSRGFASPPGGLGYCDVDDCNKDDNDGVRSAKDRLVVTFSKVVEVLWTIRETTDAWRNGDASDHLLAEGCARVNGVDRDLTGGRFEASLGAHSEWTFEACDANSAFGISDFYVTGATIAQTPPPPPAPIPVPAGAVLLGTALAGLGLGAARRKG